jgi:hypothetical protein
MIVFADGEPIPVRDGQRTDLEPVLHAVLLAVFHAVLHGIVACS